MENYFATSKGFFGSIGDLLSNTLGSISDAFEIISEAIQLPLRLVVFLPSVLGASVSIVLFIMVLKFIVGR